MAYKLKYFSEFADDQEIGYRVEIHERDYSGDETEVISSGNPFVLEVTEVDNIFSPIRTKKATIEWVATEEIAFEIKELDLADDQKYKVFLYEIGAGETLINKFTGYLVTVDCKEPFGSKPYPVQLSAACGLFFLRDYYFTSDNGEFVLDKINIKNTIGQCLQFANLELDFHTYVDLYDIQMGAGDPLALADFAADGLRGLTCYDALSGVLNAINAFVVQEGDVWVIKGIPDSAALICPRRIYDFQSVFKSQDTPNQAVSIGREPFNGTIPNLIPTESVTTSLAETSSVVKMTVEPGIPVNRLRNGQFAYPITGGNLVGWDINLNGIIYPINGTESPGWTRSGFGTIDSPYRFEMRGYGILTDQGKDKDTPSSSTDDVHIDIEDPIIIDGGLFGVGNSIKLVVSGAFRARSFQKVYIECRINDGDRDYVSWLDESGKWSLEKKKRQGIKIDVKTPFPDISLPIDELPIQTFEVISEPLNNFLNQGGRAIAKIYFRVFPGMVYGDVTPEQVAGGVAPMLALEDFSVSVTTETIYEGAHTYVVDADLPIRNANEIQFTSIVADKINIVTPEQVRLVNRVMTGYMTIHNTDNLTYGWRRRIGGQEDPIDGVPYPIQYKVLKERIRQVCGKRIIVEGDFLGYDLNASSSVFLQYDDVYDNSKFYTITNWKWDVINRRYSVKLNELSLTKLSNSQEFIELDKEGSGSRGNRLYGNASGGSSYGNGSGSPDIPDPIELDIIDPLYFVVGQESTQSFDLGELILSGQEPIDLASKFIYYPTWMLYPYEDRGEDGDLLTYTVTGTPIQKGVDRIIIEFVDPYGVDYLAVVPIIIEPKTTNKNAIISGGDIIGKVPGFLELPDSWNFQSTIKGTHDKVVISVSGGGVDGSSYSGSITREPGLVEDGIYTVGDTAIVSEAGVYEYSVITYRGLTETSREEGSFTLYDEEYLAKFSSEFIDFATSEILGVINPNGTSTFKQKSGWDIKSIITDLEHDNITYTLKQDGVVVFNNSIDVVPAELEGEYLLFNELQTEYGSGDYELLIDIKLDESPVYQRLVSFSIAEEEVKPEAGLQLIEFTNNTTNYSVTQDLPLFNAEYDLPDNWGVLIPPVDVDYDYVEWELSDSTEGALANVNLENYTNYPQYLNYTGGEDKDDILIFGLKNSLDIGDIHRAPSSFRAKATFRLGGATGKIVAITQSDFSFRVPLEPGDYSGTRYINVDVPTGVFTVIDENMPKEGRKYLLPEIGTRWSVSVLELNGEIFNKVIVKLSKKLSGSYEVLHFFGADSLLTYNSPTDVNILSDDDLAYVIGFVRPDGLRYLYDSFNNDVLIDGVGDYKATFEFYLDDSLLGSKVTEFSLIDGNDIPEIPIKDCCSGGDGEIPDQDIEAGEYGAEDETIIQTVNQQGIITAIESVKIKLIGVDFTEEGSIFDVAPTILVEGSDSSSAATIGQVAQIAANGNNKLPVKTVSTSNITLSGLQTINGYTTIAGDRVLVQNQSTPSQNGVYIAASGTWARATDSDTGSELLSAAYFVDSGDATVNGTRWLVSTPSPITVGTTPITIIKIQNSATDTRWVSLPNATDLNTATDGGIHSWGNGTANSPTNAGSLITFNGNSITGNGEGLAWTNQFLMDVNAEAFIRQRIFSYGSWTSTYKLWTTKHFSSVDINNWNSAYAASLNFNSLFDIRLFSKTTTNLAEGTNLYFTEARVRATPLTGLVSTNTASVLATDSILVAIGKLAANTKVSSDRWISSPALTDLNLGVNGGVKTWGNSTANSPSNAGTSLTFVGSSTTGNGDENPTYTNQILADVNSELFFRQRIFSYGTWTPTYKIWTTKHFVQADIDNWNLAYSLRHNALTIGTANGLSLSTQVLSLGLASSSTSGALSASDWTNFNSKQPAFTGTGLIKSTAGVISYIPESTYALSVRTILVGTGLIGGGDLTSNVPIAFDTTWGDARYLRESTGITGTGASGYLPVFTAGKVIANSIAFQSGSNISIAGTLAANIFNSNAAPSNSSAIGFNFTNANVLRWQQGKFGLEDVNNIGSDYYLSRYADNGSYLGNVYSITRATGVTTYYSAVAGIAPTANNHFVIKSYVDSNFVPVTRSILVGTGILGGGALSSNVAIAFDVAWGDVRYSGSAHTHTFASITNKPTTIAGYGITDTYTSGAIDFFLSGRVPNGRAITINGTNGRITSSAGAQDLSANRTWTLDLDTTGVGSGTYRSVTVDPFGRVTAGTNPTTLAGYGITDAYSSGTVDFLLTSRVPVSRTITINGVTQDLSTNRSWTIATNTYTAGNGIGITGNEFFVGAGTGLVQDYDGLYVNFGQNSGQVAQGNDARINNGQTAFNWGNHATQGYLTGITSPMVTNALTYTPIPNNRTITINGNTQFLNDNPNFTISSSGGNITGSGTNGYVTRWTGGTSIGNSRIIDNGSGNINFVGTGLDATNMSLSNNFYAGSGSIGGTFSASNLFAISSFTLPTKSEAGLSSAGGEGSVAYVNSGSGKGLWVNMGSNGWRLIATRLWVGASNPGSSPP